MINFHPSSSNELKPKISVIGIGGAGGNAVNNMIQSQLEGVEFIVANTDAQSLAQSRTDRRIQLGQAVTQGLGAGARPDIGRASAEETLDVILQELQGSNMVFITAGMGGGTGTGAAPVIARAAREHGILTVGVVTKPFHFEGQHRMRLAEAGIEELTQHVDTLIIIPNQNLFRVASERTTFADAFKMADDVLYSGVRGVTDLMIMPGLVNLDFADIRTVMGEMGKAMMGTGEAEGEKRALQAAEAAINNPLLEDISMKGAKGVLINITGGRDITLFEVDEAANRIRDEVDSDANIIFGSTFDDKLDGKIRISVVATGIDIADNQQVRPTVISLVEQKRPQPQQPQRMAPMPAAPQASAYAQTQAAPTLARALNRQVEAEPEVRQPVPEALYQPVEEPAPEPQPAPQSEPLLQRRPAMSPAARPAQPSQGSLRIEMPEPRLGTAAPAVRPEPEPEHEPILDEDMPRRVGGFLSRLTGHARAHAAQAHAQAQARQAEPQPQPAYQPAPQQAQQPTRVSPQDRLPSSRGTEEDLLDIPAFLRRQAN